MYFYFLLIKGQNIDFINLIKKKSSPLRKLKIAIEPRRWVRALAPQAEGSMFESQPRQI